MSGSISRTDVLDTIAARVGDAESCYREKLRLSPILKGRVTVDLLIGEKGEVIIKKRAPQ